MGATDTGLSEIQFFHRRAKTHGCAVVPAALLAGLASGMPWYFSTERDGIDIDDPTDRSFLTVLGETMATLEDVDPEMAAEVVAELAGIHPEVLDALRRWIDLHDGVASEREAGR